MNIEEYKRNKLRNIDFYLRGISYKNLEAETLLERLPEELDVIFNKLYRKETIKFINEIRNSYDLFRANELEFAETKEEVDIAITKFEKKLKQIATDFKNNILVAHAKETGYQPSIINNSIEPIKVKIRDINAEKLTREQLHEIDEIDGLREITAYIYAFIYMIKDKTIKSANLLDLINLKFSVRSPEYKLAFGKYLKIKQEKNYTKFNELYSSLLSDLGVTKEDFDYLAREETSKNIK